ncbi:MULTISPECIES: lipid IV(A) 3-deoxy-D-manno-octulosonic acid transferase [Thiorhodovibrio]|uniref:lipid IV(A) 3-deoxy-D-manno-octulosonic acid transferase n=1 Tax=Thiorhodovibrio TaxID=61593 RepID=UPI001914A2CB|nr:lipid IV(A) 3-deoxy-D-manno-octulosonic acid transferase [Thiorhodovibrio litoralis]MBK5970238.1 3-deoxy-D-manno-octulosonic acid transferase [Thiorhodovibrio winogradskyi]WPL12742.1 3-deoxy-D-manno-octulosonic acid transferase [Thiorhodovibrio litoralis]
MRRGVYSVLLYLLLPALLLRLLWRSLRAPAYRERWRERLGFYDQLPGPATIWVHAVSVGEVQAAQPMIRHLLLRDPAARILVTTTTPTGARRLGELFGDRVAHLYSPFDLTPVVRRFLARVSPCLAIVMETEIWPNLLAECESRGIPVLLVNARLSQRSASGYKRAQPLAGESMQRLSLIAAQSRADAERFIGLGAPAERVAVTGSIKFDLQLPASLTEQAEVMRRGWGCNRPVWVAASTHEGEEEPLLQAHARLREQLPAALLVLVPRHPDRFERAAALVQRRGFRLARRSLGQACDAQISVYLGDTMGELVSFIAAADVAFVGGSLVPTGGHNLLEAAAVGVPVIVGPHVFNFVEVTRLLLEQQAAVQIQSADELTRCLNLWLTDAAERARIGENGRKAVEANRGALDRLLGLIDPYVREMGST